MREIRLSLAVVWLLACSDSHGPDGQAAGSGGTVAQAGASGGAAGSTGNAGADGMPPPDQHRPSPQACDSVRPPGDPPSESIAPGQSAACTLDTDCVDGENGRCEDFRGLRMCTYDNCFSDADCTTGPCGCERGFWSDANVCLEGNCRTDGDCGAGGFCSPTLGQCGNYAGVVGYYCHTPDDECTNDRQCTRPESSLGYCKYSPEVSHWVCAYSHCVG